MNLQSVGRNKESIVLLKSLKKKEVISQSIRFFEEKLRMEEDLEIVRD